VKPLLLRGGVERCLHWPLGLVAVVGRSGVGVVEVLVLLLTGGIAAATAVAATLEAAEAATAARHTTAAAAYDTHHNTEKNETSYDHNSDDGPLAEAGCHAVVPAG
jgi:hypothetical protein